MYRNIHIAFALWVEPTVEIYGAGIVTVNPERPAVISKKLVFLAQKISLLSVTEFFKTFYRFKN
jgi:hypothetical protein